LDGARLFNLPLHSGHGVREYAALFDTVYVSLWKHFNAGTGAILAGDADFIEGLFHVRRMFGGAMPHAWPQVALAGGYADTYEAEYAKSWAAAERMIRRLESDGRYSVRRVAHGTSRFYLRAPENAPGDLVERLRTHGIMLPGGPPGAREFAMQVNPTILRREPAEIAGLLIGALAGS
ncbi:MAG TPA: beta-eliminating lyase-related protein, partial [Arenimonas sp.]|nr:beta-eliminating lyase-related protein [Arenimonas sp.]